jgi:signal peptidase I
VNSVGNENGMSGKPNAASDIAPNAASDGIARPERPSLALIKQELQRMEQAMAFRAAIWGAVKALIVVAAVSVLISTLWVPVLRVYGESMLPTLRDGDVVVSFKQSEFERGDIIAFYHNNKALLKRVVAVAGEWVDIDENGVVSVNGEPLDEPYVPEKAQGKCDIELPYRVPDGRWFVMGDHRLTSVDSRTSTIGAVSDEQIIGKVAFRVWPLNALGGVE